MLSLVPWKVVHSEGSCCKPVPHLLVWELWWTSKSFLPRTSLTYLQFKRSLTSEWLTNKEVVFMSMVVHLTIWVPVIHTSCRPRMKIIACCRPRFLKPIIKCNPSSLLESSGTTGQQDPSGIIQTRNTGGASVTDTLSLNNSALSFHSLDWTLLAWKWWMLCVVNNLIYINLNNVSYCSRYVWRHTNNIRQFNFTTSQFAVQL